MSGKIIDKRSIHLDSYWFSFNAVWIQYSGTSTSGHLYKGDTSIGPGQQNAHNLCSLSYHLNLRGTSVKSTLLFVPMVSPSWKFRSIWHFICPKSRVILDIIFYYIFNTFRIVSIDIKKYVIIVIVAVVVENRKYPVDTATPHCFQPLYSQARYRVIFFSFSLVALALC